MADGKTDHFRTDPGWSDTTIDLLNDSYDYLKTYKEHSTNRNKANENKHQYGKARKKRDKNGGEKGDKRRKRYK